jgi:cytochrome c-type biogenesis protein CcmH/NrfG
MRQNVTIADHRTDVAAAPPACPGDDAMAAFLDGALPPDERLRVEAHVADCPRCLEWVSGVMHAMPEVDRLRTAGTELEEIERAVARHDVAAAAVVAERPHVAREPGRAPVWKWAAAALPVAAVLVLAVRVMWSPGGAPDALDEAVATMARASGDYRPYETRLSDFAYKPLEPATRSGGSTVERPLALREAALAVESLAAGAPGDVRSARALAAMHLLLRAPDRAVAVLAPLAGGSADAALLSDLGAALLARAGPGDAARAVEVCERAVALEPGRAEAWFNLGLAAEAIQDLDRARGAWTKSLEIEPRSPWAAEVEALVR